MKPLACIVFLALVAPLQAQELGQPPRDAPRPPPVARAHRHWYGWQILINDVAPIAVSAGAKSTNTDAGSIGSAVGTAAWFVGSPVIHIVHHRTNAGLGALGVRLALPVGGLLVGAAIGDSNCDAND